VTAASGRKALRIFSGLPWWAWVLIVVLVEATLWQTLIPSIRAVRLGGDGSEYQLVAGNLIHHGAFSESVSPPYYETVIRSPGYPAFLALFDWFGAWRPTVVLTAQFGVTAALAIVVGLIGRDVAGRAVGTIAALICATYLPFLEYATHFLTEDLAGFCLAALVLLLLVARSSDRILAYVGAGVALAALTYVRPEFILLVLPIAVILVTRRHNPWRSPGRWTGGLGFTAAFVAALVPWTIRNAIVTDGRVLPMAATSGIDLLVSADQYDGFLSYKLPLSDVYKYQVQEAAIAPIPRTGYDADAQVRRDAKLRAAAVRLFKSLSFGEVASGLPERIAYLWGTADILPAGSWAKIGHRLAQIQYALLVLLGVVGLTVRRRLLLRDWPLWIGAAYLSLLHFVSHIEDRYTLPARPMLMLYAAAGLLALTSALRRRNGRARSRTDGLRGAHGSP
jgi:hypothetical protein